MKQVKGPGDDSHPWPWSISRDDWTPWPIRLNATAMQVIDLIGKKCRFVKVSDRVPESFEPGRITVLLTEEGRILEIYQENDLPEI